MGIFGVTHKEAFKELTVLLESYGGHFLMSSVLWKAEELPGGEVPEASLTTGRARTPRARASPSILMLPETGCPCISVGTGRPSMAQADEGVAGGQRQQVPHLINCRALSHHHLILVP